MFKIATWNVNSLRVRLPHLRDWLMSEQPDVMALQETKLTDDIFPLQEISTLGYQAVYSGQKTYNGVAIISKQPGQVIADSLPDYSDPQKRVLCGIFNGICVLNLYVPNGGEIDSDKYRYKLEWLSRLQPFVEDLLRRYPRCVALGDFNIAPADEDVHDPAEWAGQVLCSAPEREAFFRLIDAGMADCYRIFPRREPAYSWWDYRAAAFRRNRGLRIDHILAGKDLARLCTSCRIDIAPRKLEKPSDHAPVVAEFEV
jgi:exodeoxyribonuclease-3